MLNCLCGQTHKVGDCYAHVSDAGRLNDVPKVPLLVTT